MGGRGLGRAGQRHCLGRTATALEQWSSQLCDWQTRRNTIESFEHSTSIKMVEVEVKSDGILAALFVWCLTARQHRIGQFVPTAGG